MRKGSSEERVQLKGLFRELLRQPILPFPLARKPLNAPYEQGVYIIRDKKDRIAHVGRTNRGKYGLYQRLADHLAGQSSFVGDFLNNEKVLLRRGYTYQYLTVPDHRTRALLEYLATGLLCPMHCGTGSELRKDT